MWFMNLDTLPPGRSMYTAFLGTEEDPGDEVDFVAASGLNAEQAEIALRSDEGFLSAYDVDEEVLGIADQSDGYIVLDRRSS